MSQRKEKYLRHTLEQHAAIARDVDHLNARVPTIARDLEQVRDRQADIDRALARERRKHRRDNRTAHRAFLVSVLALVLAAASLLIAAAERVDPAEKEEDMATMTVASAPVYNALAHEGTVEAGPLPSMYSEEIPLTEEEQTHLLEAADAFGIWYPLAVAMVDVETDFRNIAGDGGDSIGYLQVNQYYHTELMEQVGATDLWEPRDNFRTGLAYLATQIERSGTVHMGLMAYNMGPTGAARAWEEGMYESTYSRSVMERTEHWAEILGWQ